jgi:hypothetical protein
MAIVSSDMAAGYVSRDGYQYEAVVWNKDGTVRGLGVPQGGINSRALAINTRGYACGIGEHPAGFWHAVVFNRQATWLVDDGEMRFSGCEAIHASGLMIGTRQTFQDYLLHAFVWTSPTVGYDLHALLGGQQSWGCCVSDTLWVAGTVQTPPEMHAWRWWGVPEVLADLPGLGSCQAFGLSRHGEVVGACGVNNVLITGGGSTGQDSRAVLWDVNGTPFDLNTLALLPEGWTLMSARAINKDGDITCIAHVAGDVLPNGEPRDRGCLLERLPNAASR